MATREGSQKGGKKKKQAKGEGLSQGDSGERGWMGKDRRREGYRHPIKKCSESGGGSARLQTDTEAEDLHINAHTAGCGIEAAAAINRRTRREKKSETRWMYKQRARTPCLASLSRAERSGKDSSCLANENQVTSSPFGTKGMGTTSHL